MSLGEYNGAGSGTTKLLLHLNGNSTDSSGNSNSGTDTSVTYSLANGYMGQGGGFVTATPSRISLPAGMKQTGSFTFSAWIYPLTLTPVNVEAIIHTDWSGTGKNYVLEQENSTLLFLNGNGSTLQDTALKGGTLIANTWQLATFTRSGTTQTIYLNGNSVATKTSSYSGGSTTQNRFIGCEVSAAAGYGFGGNLDEVIIENVAWSAAKVKQYYTFTKGRFGII